MKKVSIVIPVYNVEKYLRDCMDSVIVQTYQDIEVIVVNDGSTDNSGIICDEYAAKDDRFRVIHKENGGAASAKNVGLDHATGDYIAFLDSDDYVEPNWIGELVNALESNYSDVAECNFLRELINFSEVGNDSKYYVGAFTTEDYLANYLDNWTCSLFWNKLFKAELIKNVRFRSERRCIDDEFFTYKVLSAATKIVRIDNQLYHYRQRRSSVVSSEKNKKQITDDALEILIERYEWICKRFPKLRKIYLKHDIEIMFYFARNFIFTEETIRKFRRIAKYYLYQSLLHFPGRITLQYAIMLQTLKKKAFKTEYIPQNGDTPVNLFP